MPFKRIIRHKQDPHLDIDISNGQKFELSEAMNKNQNNCYAY